MLSEKDNSVKATTDGKSFRSGGTKKSLNPLKEDIFIKEERRGMKIMSMDYAKKEHLLTF